MTRVWRPVSSPLDRRHDQDFRCRLFKLPDRRRAPRPVEAKRQTPRRTMFGERRFRRDDRSGRSFVPLRQSQVAVSRLEEPSFAITGALLPLVRSVSDPFPRIIERPSMRSRGDSTIAFEPSFVDRVLACGPPRSRPTRLPWPFRLPRLGTLLPYVPRKILPRLDRLSPLPISQLPKKMPFDFK